MTTAREEILKKIRQTSRTGVELPSLNGPWIQFPEPVQAFADTLKFVGGKAVLLNSRSELITSIQEQEVYQSAREVVSGIQDLKGNIPFGEISDPHHLERVDVGIFEGAFGVAENAAVWLVDKTIRHRAILFIVQHLFLVIRERDLVHNMHQAYERLSFNERNFGVFISGPSKTADIEQSLVIGAHGPRSMTVFVIRHD